MIIKDQIECPSCLHQFVPEDYWEMTKDVVQEVECPKCGDPVRFVWSVVTEHVFKNAD